MSEPVKLKHTGLWVSVPVGRGWQESDPKWRYEDNSFILSNFFIMSSNIPHLQAVCRYRLVADESAADIQLKQRAAEMGGTILRTGQIRTGTLTVDWAEIQSRKLVYSFLGIVNLPDSRQLTVLVEQFTGEDEPARHVFSKIAGSLRFEDNKLLEAGAVIVKEIKNTGLDVYLKGIEPQSFFLIKNAQKRATGFTMHIMTSSGLNADLNINGSVYNYRAGRNAVERVAVFQSDNTFDEYGWKSEITGAAGGARTELILNKTGEVTVRKSGLKLEETHYRLSPAAVPEFCIEGVFKRMIKDNQKKIIVDIVLFGGEVVPTMILRSEEQSDNNMFRLDFLEGFSHSEDIYLDESLKIVKMVWTQKGEFAEHATLKDIVERFRERSDYVLQESEKLKQKKI